MTADSIVKFPITRTCVSSYRFKPCSQLLTHGVRKRRGPYLSYDLEDLDSDDVETILTALVTVRNSKKSSVQLSVRADDLIVLLKKMR